MKPFMSNNCKSYNCLSDGCHYCSLYNPAFLGMSVPKTLGNFLYKIEAFLIRIKIVDPMKRN